jgi:V-type H+-transporting ATPase subunit a
MFGDLGHGSIVFLLGLFLIFKDKPQGLLANLWSYRYFITLMGFFATYCGLIYNDFFSLTTNFFGEFCEHKRGCVYYFGTDPKWSLSLNQLTFSNSLKMKLSIILGVS